METCFFSQFQQALSSLAASRDGKSSRLASFQGNSLFPCDRLCCRSVISHTEMMSVTPHPGEMIINHPDSVGPIQTGITLGTRGFYLFIRIISDTLLYSDSEVVLTKREDPCFISGRAPCSIFQQPGVFLAESPREAPAFFV